MLMPILGRNGGEEQGNSHGVRLPVALASALAQHGMLVNPGMQLLPVAE